MRELGGYLGGYGGLNQAITRAAILGVYGGLNKRSFERLFGNSDGGLEQVIRSKPDSRQIIFISSVTMERLMSYQLSSPPKNRSTPDAEDGIISWGFGFEFENCIRTGLEDVLERQEARLNKYGPFGMEADDAREDTPEHLRDAYRQFVERERADVHTPSLSPSSESIHCPARSINETRTACRRMPHRRSTLRKRNGGQGNGKQTTHGNTAPTGIKKCRSTGAARLTHHMVTRSQKRTVVWVSDPGLTTMRKMAGARSAPPTLNRATMESSQVEVYYRTV